jgi:hypothetical protein
MSDLMLTRSLVVMLERIEQHSGALLMLAVTASGGGEYGKLNKLRCAGYVVKCDHPSVTDGAWPAEALAITEAGRAALANHRGQLTEKKGPHRPGDKRVIFRRDGDRYIVFLDDDRLGFVRVPIMERGIMSIRRWHIVAMLRPENGPVSYCAIASSGWFARARYEGYPKRDADTVSEQAHPRVNIGKRNTAQHQIGTETMIKIRKMITTVKRFSRNSGSRQIGQLRGPWGWR